MDTVRVFIAIELEAGLVSALGRLQRGLREQVALPLRWVDLSGVHLTLKFFGNVEQSRLEDIEAGMKAAATPSAPFELALGSLGAFPNVRRPRVVWIGLGGPTDELLRLQGRIETEMVPRGFPREGRSFRPHLTLARARAGAVRGPGLDQIMLSELAVDAEGVTQQATSMSLIRSDLRPTGAVYTRLASVPFG